ncbi:hypothetical protein LTR37_018908 [Vermiconidia calcicola]|uniref:Uncharacterized protein n=1 Tax=Vermiconidia calcicola TaxID=1690605 RepID=A0ACC3MH70_9PEZI|nr:hypothetical protein LTR37_018908 [Vermiconidia calcicola]
MSLWDKYLAPGDIRRRQLAQPTKDDTSQQPIAKPTPQPSPPRLDAGHRVRRQNALLYGGLAFTFLSLLVTRRTLIRKKLELLPINPDPNAITPGSRADGTREAIHALGLATLNVFSVAMASVGAAMTYFDVADMEDVRKNLGWSVPAGDSAADREIEAWVAEVLAKDGEKGLKEGMASKIAELQERDKKEEVNRGRDGR